MTSASNTPFTGTRLHASTSARYFLIFPMAVVSSWRWSLTPLAILVLQSTGEPAAAFSLAKFYRIFHDAYTFSILVSTLRLGLITTIVVAFISYPIGIAFLYAAPRQRTWLLFLIVLPLLTSTVVRTFAWIVILGRYGPINALLVKLGIAEEPIQILFTEPGDSHRTHPDRTSPHDPAARNEPHPDRPRSHCCFSVSWCRTLAHVS